MLSISEILLFHLTSWVLLYFVIRDAKVILVSALLFWIFFIFVCPIIEYIERNVIRNPIDVFFSIFTILFMGVIVAFHAYVKCYMRYRINKDIIGITDPDPDLSRYKKELGMFCKELFSKSSIKNDCIICFDPIRTYAILPCGHYQHCFSCLLKINKCSLCRNSPNGVFFLGPDANDCRRILCDLLRTFRIKYA